MSVSVVAVPTFPLPRSVTGTGHGARLAAAAERVVADLPGIPTLVMLIPGSEPLVEDVTALALSDRTITVAGAPEMVAAVVERGQVPRVQAAALGGRAAALGALILAARPGARFVGVTIPGRADPPAIEGAAAALHGALDVATDAVLVVPGDLGPSDASANDDLGDSAAAVRGGLYAHDTSALATVAADHPVLAPALAPVRLALRIAHARGQRFEIHADAEVDGVLRVVGAVR